MGIILCSDCGKSYDDDLAFCPHCGERTPQRKPPRRTVSQPEVPAEPTASGETAQVTFKPVELIAHARRIRKAGEDFDEALLRACKLGYPNNYQNVFLAVSEFIKSKGGEEFVSSVGKDSTEIEVTGTTTVGRTLLDTSSYEVSEEELEAFLEKLPESVRERARRSAREGKLYGKSFVVGEPKVTVRRRTAVPEEQHSSLRQVNYIFGLILLMLGGLILNGQQLRIPNRIGATDEYFFTAAEGTYIWAAGALTLMGVALLIDPLIYSIPKPRLRIARDALMAAAALLGIVFIFLQFATL